jgi:predicted nucleic acid-binding protein
LQPTPLADALNQVDAWMESPTLMLLSESDRYWDELRVAVERGQVVGPRVHDARIAALSHYYDVAELWSADRDFSRFPDLVVRNPLIDSSNDV